MAARFKAIQLRKKMEQEELNAVTDAMRQAEESRRVMARAFHEKRAHDLLSQAQSRMEGTMIAPVEKATALERVKGVGEFGLVRQFPAPSTEIPVGGGFRLGGSMPSMSGKRMYPTNSLRRDLGGGQYAE